MSPSRSTTLESTWAAQEDLPLLDATLVEKLGKDVEDKVVGKYAVSTMLGEGEFARVYLCVDPEDQATYALKAINKAHVERHSSILKSKRNIKRVNTEVMAMRKLGHAGVCQLRGAMQSATTLYLVLERGERDLFEFLDAFPEGCPEAIIKAIMRILALGLRHCHNRGIAHRDIKPENILVVGNPTDWLKPGNEDSGIVKLCDFGLCADVSEVPDGILSDFVGSPGFFAPELMMRSKYHACLADMWSVGAVLVEMMLGHAQFDRLWCPPYDHLTDVQKFSNAVCTAVSRVKLGSMASPPSEPISRLLEQLLQVEPGRRANVEQICAAPWFGLLKSDPSGAMSMLRLTFAPAGEEPAAAAKPTRRARDRKVSRAALPNLDGSNKGGPKSGSTPEKPTGGGSIEEEAAVTPDDKAATVAAGVDHPEQVPTPAEETRPADSKPATTQQASRPAETSPPDKSTMASPAEPTSSPTEQQDVVVAAEPAALVAAA